MDWKSDNQAVKYQKHSTAKSYQRTDLDPIRIKSAIPTRRSMIDGTVSRCKGLLTLLSHGRSHAISPNLDGFFTYF